MTTPPKLPASSRTSRAMLWLGVLAIAGIAAALLLPPLTLSRPTEPEPEVTLTVDNARSVCMELSENLKEYLSREEWDRRNARRAQAARWPLQRRLTT